MNQGPGSVTYDYQGKRFVLGHTTTYYALWDSRAPGAPLETFPLSHEGWASAWNRYSALEAAEPAYPMAPPVAQPYSTAPPPGQPYAPAPSPGQPYAPPGQPYSTAPPAGPMTGQAAQPARVSAGWWIVPILFGVIGGAIAWAATKDRNRAVARNLFIAGVIASVVWFLITSSL
jgi:hypothetical protein